MGSQVSDIDIPAAARDELGFSRWWQLIATIVMMGLVSPYKYVWASIQGPLARDLNLSLPALGFVFTLYVIFLSVSQFPAGICRDRVGPRWISVLAGLLAGGSYVGLAYASQLWHVYVLYSVGAIGVGIVYTVGTNTALKWFPDRRGLTTGATTMAFALGSTLFIPYVRANEATGEISEVLQTVGILICAGVVLGALVLQDPSSGWLEDTVAESDPEASTETKTVGGRQYTWREMINTWQFWILATIFAGIAGTSFMLTANLVSFAENAGIRTSMVTAAAAGLPIADGVGRLSVGGLSDHIGRERTMFLSFTLCGLGVATLTAVTEIGVGILFIAAVVIAAFFQGTQYTLVPSVTADYYGEENSSANYAVVYGMELVGGIFGGLGASWLVTVTGWSATFLIGGVLALTVGLCSLLLDAPSDRTVT